MLVLKIPPGHSVRLSHPEYGSYTLPRERLPAADESLPVEFAGRCYGEILGLARDHRYGFEVHGLVNVRRLAGAAEGATPPAPGGDPA